MRMKNRIHIAFSYLRYYKKQTAALLLGIILSSALFTCMGSLLESGKKAALENSRKEYGDWHYSVRGDYDWMEEYKKDTGGEGFTIEKTGMKTVRKVLEYPFSIEVVYADDGYMDMMGRKLLEGSYPQDENKIAMDAQTLLNLGLPKQLGTQVQLDGEVFTLCGIFTDMPKKMQTLNKDVKQVFVNDTLDYGQNGSFFYVKFDEKHKVYKQLEAFCKNYGIEYKTVARNNGIAGYAGGEPPAVIWEVIKTGISYKEAGLPYIWGQLNQEGRLTESAILTAAALFGAFIIFSLFQISVVRRMSQYSVMETLGMTDGCRMGLVLCELGAVALAGYPAGCLVGNLAAWRIYDKAGRIFMAGNPAYHITGVRQPSASAALSLPEPGSFMISWHSILWGSLCMAAIIVTISITLIRRMKRLTIRQMAAKEPKKHPSRKIYSRECSNITGILTRRFMFARKGTFMGILLSLSIGSVIFLGSFYVTENTKINNELTFKADDGLGSDIEISIQSDRLTDNIPQTDVQKMEQINGIEILHPVRYLLGELPLNDGRLLWTSYFADIADDEANPPNPVLKEKYNGTAVQTGEDDYALKVNIYGYDDAMLEDMKDYLLDGNINPDQMRKDNSVIVKTLMDGQGNYDGVDIKPGEYINLKTVESPEVPQKALRFQGNREWYQEEKLLVTGLAGRSLAKVDSFIGDEDVIDIIMTNEQMERNFGVRDYRTVSISLKKGAVGDRVSDQLGKITREINRCVLKDYSQQIKEQNLYLAQKMLFFYGIAAVLLGISLLHVMNSLQYLIAARKHEFGILRAMGITDSGFRKMLAKEGFRFGIFTGLTVGAVYLLLQKVLYYFMVHIYLYVKPQAFISWEALVFIILLNIVICAAVMLLSGETILRGGIIEEINE